MLDQKTEATVLELSTVANQALIENLRRVFEDALQQSYRDGYERCRLDFGQVRQPTGSQPGSPEFDSSRQCYKNQMAKPRDGDRYLPEERYRDGYRE